MKFNNWYAIKNEFFVRMPLLPTYACNSPLDLEEKNLSSAAIAINSIGFSKRVESHGSDSHVAAAKQRYLKRMSHRATPFGLLAGVSKGVFGHSTTLKRASLKPQTVSRPDMSWVLEQVAKLESNHDVQRLLHWFVNPEALVMGQNLWLERGGTAGSKKRSKTVSVKLTLPVQTVLQLAQTPISFAELVERLYVKFGGNESSAQNLCHFLCDNGVLLSQLRMAPNDFNRLFGDLSELSSSDTTSRLLEEIKRAVTHIAEWDNSLNSPTDYAELLSRFAGENVLEQPFVQVDSTQILSHNNLSYRVRSELSHALEVILKTSVNRKNPVLERYLALFDDRYQMGKEVPLLELLSPRFGLGSPYTAEISSEYFDNNYNLQREAKLLNIAQCASQKKLLSIELTDQDIDELQSSKLLFSNLPSSIDFHVGLVAQSREELDSGNFSIIPTTFTGINGAGRSTGRFAHLFDDLDFWRSLAKEEQELSESLLVDVAFIPDIARFANVAISPNVRSHCISSNTVPPSEQITIPLAEITIGVTNARFYARWAKTGQIVIAHSSNVLNFSFAPEPIRFLLQIAGDGFQSPKVFELGKAAELTFFPRLTHQKVIIRAASWNLNQFTKPNSLFDFEQEFGKWSRQWNLPDLVKLTSGWDDDNFLFLDLREPSDLRQLHRALRQESMKEPILHEYIPIDGWNTFGRGSFATEIVASFTRNKTATESATSPSIPKKAFHYSTNDVLRPPGSEWLYLKLKGSSQFHEYLINDLANFLTDLKQRDHSISWFFVRYQEPLPELRIRVGVNQSTFSHTLIALLKWSRSHIDSKVIRQISIETYEREIERYGGRDGMNLAEDLFCLDSELACQILSSPCLKNVDRAVLTTLTALFFLQSLGMNDIAISLLLTHEKERKYTGDYRKHKLLLNSLLGLSSCLGKEHYEPILKIIDEYRERFVALGKRLSALDSFEKLTCSKTSIVRSLLHMHCVRLLGINPDIEKMVTNFLIRLTETQINRVAS
ncbi:MAG: lantibiotic dehydratase [Candidatus Obscuribacterales bacterium]